MQKLLLSLLFLPICVLLANDPEDSDKENNDKQSPIFNVSGTDPEMLKAYELARKNFRYFWREISWEYRRIIPGLSMAVIKAPFSDEKDGYVEHMWVSNIDFDGKTITGTLSSQPKQLKSVKNGDSVSIPLSKISDWIYVIDGKTYGGYTVHAIRSKMKPKRRQEHDKLWGFDFGDSDDIRVCPNFGKEKDGEATYDRQAEHPMSKNMVEKLEQALNRDPKFMESVDANGMNSLHQQALAGNTSCVEALIRAGADLSVKTKRGATALMLAKEAGWSETVKVLEGAEDSSE